MAGSSWIQLLLLAAVVAQSCQGALADPSSSEVASSTHSSGHTRHLLQPQYSWPRESAAITGTLTIVNALANSGSSPADGLRTGARGLEIARLASNKEAKPWEFDRPAVTEKKTPRQQNTLGRRMMA